jgi:hypothetical protein
MALPLENVLQGLSAEPVPPPPRPHRRSFQMHTHALRDFIAPKELLWSNRAPMALLVLLSEPLRRLLVGLAPLALPVLMAIQPLFLVELDTFAPALESKHLARCAHGTL